MMKVVDPSLIVPVPGKRHLLILDRPEGGLAGAAVLDIDGTRGHVSALAIAPEYEGTHLEDRFIAVMEAMCEAFGVRSLDIPARRAA
ncbi:MAG TPA: hypothetical protein VMZ53_29440 [Kofleriaceae bacterium]|nr:hypothetical protein [Kofleriaceae bacterium]